MISFVIPVYNEQDSLRVLHREISEVMLTVGREYEIIFVDDGSTDGSSQELQAIEAIDACVIVLSFGRNQGKSNAYHAAFEHCAGDLIVTMDADLQDVPAELPNLLAKLNQGHDVVVGWKRARLSNEPSKALPSKVFNGLLGVIFGLRLHDSNCGYRLLTRAAAMSLDLRGDLYRFIPQILHISGYRVTECPVEHRKRRFGRSKYGPVRFVTGLLDVLTLRFVSRYYTRPLHFFGTIGLGLLFAGFSLEAYALVMKYFFGSIFRTHITAIVTGVMLFLAGLQCVLTGLVGEMIQHANKRRGAAITHRHLQELPRRGVATQIVNGNEDSQRTTSNSVSTNERNP